MSAEPNSKGLVFYLSGQQFPNRRIIWVFVERANFLATVEILIPWAGHGLTTCIDLDAHGPRGPLEVWEPGDRQVPQAVMQEQDDGASPSQRWRGRD